MKLIINYDLIKKVNTANGIIDYKRIISKSFRLSTIGWLAGISFVGITYGYKDADLLSMLESYLTCNLGIMAMSSILERFQKRTKAEDALEELEELALQMQTLGLDTSAELLKDATLIETKHEITFNHLKPTIKEKKYILIHNYNYQKDIIETSLLQEHNLGSKDYILSIGSKEKKLKKVLVNNCI